MHKVSSQGLPRYLQSNGSQFQDYNYLLHYRLRHDLCMLHNALYIDYSCYFRSMCNYNYRRLRALA
jgi:hypothetical protein